MRVHVFPNDPVRRAAWTRAVPRKDFAPTKNTVLCEKHFVSSDYVKTSKYTDVKTGKTIEVPLKVFRLKPDAVPSVFPNCPQYLSHQNACTREAPEEKRKRFEDESLRIAIEKSLEEKQQQDKQNKVTSFSEFLRALPSFNTSPFWSVVSMDSKVLFLDLTVDRGASVRSSVIVQDSMCVEVYFGETRVVVLDGVSVPAQLQDLRQLSDILHHVECLRTPHSSNNFQWARQLLATVMALLEELICNDQQHKLHGWPLEIVKFIKSQVQLILNNAARYPPDLLVFASLLYTISPHAYRFLIGSLKVKLPHPETIRRLCTTQQISPAMEQQDSYFLSYAKKVATTMKEHEKIVTLMMDEIHIQSYFDFKAGSITGAAANTASPAKTAYVFMTQSLLSNHKDVVHILPVATIDAKCLHDFLRMLVLKLEHNGFKVIAIISDNNSINRKTMSLFSSPPRLQIVYKHPADQSRPLFFVVDPVHLLKCIRNNWLNQRNAGRCMYFPDPKSTEAKPKILTASFKTLCELHESEQSELLKMAPTLSLKALNPSNMERQDVKLALRIFNSSTVAALHNSNLQHADSTALYINTLLTWWNIVNVKTPRKGQRLSDDLQKPITSTSCLQLQHLEKTMQWLDYWESLKHDAGHLTRETHSAFCHTTHALHEITIYCLKELGMQYVLLGKFQTDCLEDRFGRYRQLSGANYHVSIRQIYESETKLRLQKVLELPDVDMVCDIPVISASSLLSQFDITVNDSDIENKVTRLPAVTYVAGYCAHAALKKLLCQSCKENLVMDVAEIDTAKNVLIMSMTRGGLKFPRELVINAVLTMEIVLDKLRSPRFATQFFALPKQKEVLVALVYDILSDNDDLDVCVDGHAPQQVMHYILSAAANTLLNNLCKTANDKMSATKAKTSNDKLPATKAKRKLETVKN